MITQVVSVVAPAFNEAGNLPEFIKKNIFAVQFHPEKSGPKGIEIYHNWLFV